MDWLKCNICFNTYNDSSLRPRSLSCGHTFCETCLGNTIQNKTLTCPQCRKIFEIDSVVDLPINFIVEGLLKSLNPCSQDVIEGAISRPIEGECLSNEKSETNTSLKSILEKQHESFSAQKELLKVSAGMCNEHSGYELIFRCSSHKCWVCEKCIEEKGDHPKHNCTIISFKDEIEFRKQEHKVSLENEEKTCDKTILLIEEQIIHLSEKREKHFSLVDALLDLVTLHKNEDEKLVNAISSFEKNIDNGKSVKQKILDVKKTILNAETLDDANAARDVVENQKSDARNWMKHSKREVNEGKLKVKASTHLEMATQISLEYREKYGLQQEEADTNNNQLEQNKLLENEVNLIKREFTEKKESRTSKAANDEECKAHHKSIEHRCLTCQRWLCTDCLKFHTTVTQCSTIDASTAINNIKDLHMESIDHLLSDFEKNIKCLFSKIQINIDKIHEITVKKEELSKQEEEHAKNIENIQYLLEQSKQIKEKVINSKNLLNYSDAPFAVTEKIEVLAEMKQELRSWSITNLGTATHNDIYPLTKALEGNKKVYVESVILNEKRYGKLSLQDGKWYFHKFLAQKRENGCEIMSYDRLLELIPPCPSLIFVVFSLGALLKGKIIVKLDKNLPNLRENMVKVVMGMNGNSLYGTKLYRNQPYLCANNLAFSEMRVIPDTNATSKGVRGDVVGQYQNGYFQSIRFNVTTHGFPNNKVIGSIISGLEILLECHDSDQSVVIIDCGLVLQQEVEEIHKI